MTRVDEFDAFYSATQRVTLVTTYAKCGDRDVARDATIEAYRHAWAQWARVSAADPAAFVRAEAWKGTALIRSTHPLRRKRPHDTDRALLKQLDDLDQPSRRLISLMTIADVDLDEAALEVGVGDEEALELASRGFSRIEEGLGASLDEVVERMRALAVVTAGMDLPTAPEVRRSASRGARRNTVLAVVAALVLTLFGGAFVAQGDAMERQSALPDREKIGAESRDIVLDSHNIGTDDLLSASEVAHLRPDTTWKVDATDTDPKNATPYATCPTSRFADPDPLKVFVRAFSNERGGRVAQALEVSRSQAASEAAFDRLVSFYAGCQHPRTRLVDAYRVERPFGDFDILRLQSYRSPARFITVGLAQSGSLTSTLVHEAPGTERTDVREFARVLNESISRVCADSGGDCTERFTVTSALPPPVGKYPEFLDVVDLPPVKTVDSVWSASAPIEVGEQNPTATLCDDASFTGKSVVQAQARVFAIPEAPVLPEQFALTQTVGRFTDDRAAKAFYDRIRKKVDRCPDSDLPAKIDEAKKIRGEGFTGMSWRIGLEIGKNKVVYYRMGIVRRGKDVTQVLFPPAGKFAISGGEFRAVLKRAGERLAYAPQ
ncbi:hypothetical protein GL325_07640 [Aeromicrobium sp. 636]|uniref:Uncharacterized protein n=1 Tax=Aeromicrobium senzhongii TaxID=2663859 RepID=A0A8I0ETK2_9ACTN|nr:MULTISPECIES: hypothetical protein [Aeromicrobium]MBC9226186.1 hypothetical protein [Aeromicrobium senzhongii]MCQ3998292.1 hypothetical protein [Aeromicrobium sp. 636]